MEDNKKTLNESLLKIKGMMYYDSQKTAFENEKVIEEQLGAPGMGVVNALTKRAINKTQPPKETHLGNFGRALVRPQGLLVKYLKYLTNNRDTLSKSPRGISDEKISELVETIYKLTKGVDFNQFPLATAFETLQTPSDFYALADSFNTKYGAWRKFDKAILRQNKSVRVANRITDALRMISARTGGTTPSTADNAQGTVTAGGKTGWFPECPQGINKLGCKSDMIGQVQNMLGGLKVDNMFGQKTQERLAQVAPEFSQQFTDADVQAIAAKLKSPVREPAPAKIDTTNIKTPNVARPVQGATNMAQGFVNESTISHSEMKRINKEARLNKKLGIKK